MEKYLRFQNAREQNRHESHRFALQWGRLRNPRQASGFLEENRGASRHQAWARLADANQAEDSVHRKRAPGRRLITYFDSSQNLVPLDKNTEPREVRDVRELYLRPNDPQTQVNRNAECSTTRSPRGQTNIVDSHDAEDSGRGSKPVSQRGEVDGGTTEGPADMFSQRQV